MSRNRNGIFRRMMVRILFYGLLFVGPCALTESHTLYVRMKQECTLTDSADANEKTRQEFRRKIALLDAVGMSAVGLWLAWPGLAFAWQIKRIVQERRLKRSHKSAIISPLHSHETKSEHDD